MNKLNDKYSALMGYAQRRFGFASLISEFDVVRRFKQTNDSTSAFGIVSGLMQGLTSLSELSEHAGLSRSVLEDFLNLEGLPRRMKRFVGAMIKRMKRGKMIALAHVRGKCLASVDGIETFRRKLSPEDFYDAVLRGLVGQHCQVSVHRDAKTGGIDHFEIYHRVVIVCMITDRGPMPLAWRYQESAAGEAVKAWLNSGKTTAFPLSEDVAGKAKQQGELTVLKLLLPEIKAMFNGYLPFDVLVGDGLYDKATILEMVERHGVALIAVLKDERRSLRAQALEDFSTRSADRAWNDDGRGFQGWSGIYLDVHLNRKDQSVKIVRVQRQNANGTTVDNYFYCSNETWITPRFVEWCRHYRWREENGFNAWTNLWGVLKHVFHHTANACDAILGFIFTAIIIVENYRHGNLKRGSRKYTATLREFFRDVVAAYRALVGADFLRVYLNSIAATD